MNQNRILKTIKLKIEEQVFIFLQKILEKKIISFYELFLVIEIKTKKSLMIIIIHFSQTLKMAKKILIILKHQIYVIEFLNIVKLIPVKKKMIDML